MVQGPDIHFIEHRRFPRYHCAGEAEILQRERCWGWGRVNEISRGGCYIEIVHPLPPDADAQLRLTIADTRLDICAKVVSTTPLVGMAMAFVVEAPEQWTKLIQLVETITAKDLSPTGQASATQNDGYVHYALRHLHQAQEGLEVAMRNKGGNCVKALQLLEGAIEELEQGTKRCPREPVGSASTSGGAVLRDELFEKWLSTGL